MTDSTSLQVIVIGPYDICERITEIKTTTIWTPSECIGNANSPSEDYDFATRIQPIQNSVFATVSRR